MITKFQMTPRDRKGVAIRITVCLFLILDYCLQNLRGPPGEPEKLWIQLFLWPCFNSDKMAQVFYSFLSLTPRQLPTLHLLRKLPNIGFQRNFSYWYKYVDGVFQLIQMDSSTFTFFWRRNINATAFCVHTNYYIEVFEKEIPYWQEPQDNYLYKKRRCRRTIFIQVLLLYQMSWNYVNPTRWRNS